MLGVDSFLLADNGGSDQTSDLLTALDEAGPISRLDWHNRRIMAIARDARQENRRPRPTRRNG